MSKRTKAKSTKSTKSAKPAKKRPDRLTGDPGILRLCQRAGVTRVKEDVYNEGRETIGAFLEKLTEHSISCAEYDGRKTVKRKDVQKALGFMGKELAY
jgi:histone H3/H4